MEHIKAVYQTLGFEQKKDVVDALVDYLKDQEEAKRIRFERLTIQEIKAYFAETNPMDFHKLIEAVKTEGRDIKRNPANDGSKLWQIVEKILNCEKE